MAPVAGLSAGQNNFLSLPEIESILVGSCGLQLGCYTNRINDDDDHHHISVMELGHLLTRSGLTYPEVSSKVCHDSFC